MAGKAEEDFLQHRRRLLVLLGGVGPWRGSLLKGKGSWCRGELELDWQNRRMRPSSSKRHMEPWPLRASSQGVIGECVQVYRFGDTLSFIPNFVVCPKRDVFYPLVTFLSCNLCKICYITSLACINLHEELLGRSYGSGCLCIISLPRR